MAYNDSRGRRSWQSSGRSGSRYGRQSSSYRGGGYQSGFSSRPIRRQVGDGRTGGSYQTKYSRGDGRISSRRPSRGVQKYSGSRLGYQVQYQQRSVARTGRFGDRERGGGSSRGTRSRGRSGRGSRGGRRGRFTGVPMTREQLDAEMEDYFKKDKSRGAQLLDEELDDYFAPRKDQPAEAAKAEQEDVAMAD